MFKRILVPTDFSEASLEPLDCAVDLAKRYEGELFLLHVVEPVYYAVPAIEVIAEQREFARAELARLVETLAARNVKCHTLLRTGTPYLEIVDAARQNAADVIVMATHGRTGFSHIVMGSVAEKVVRTSACPVLTVRSFPRVDAGAGANASREARPEEPSAHPS